MVPSMTSVQYKNHAKVKTLHGAEHEFNPFKKTMIAWKPCMVSSMDSIHSKKPWQREDPTWCRAWTRSIEKTMTAWRPCMLSSMNSVHLRKPWQLENPAWCREWTRPTQENHDRKKTLHGAENELDPLRKTMIECENPAWCRAWTWSNAEGRWFLIICF